MKRAVQANGGSRPRSGVTGVESSDTRNVTRRELTWLFRVVLVIAPSFLLLGLTETVLRLAGIGYPVSFLVPSIVDGRKVRIENDQFGWRFFGPELAREPYPLSLPDPKPPNTVRIFVFGESAAYGDPQPEYGLPRMLEALLSPRYPGTRFEVVNAAMTAINSHAVLPIARDCSRCEGDIWVLYMGNNEVVGPFGAGTVFGPQAPGFRMARMSLAARTSRTVQGLEALVKAMRPAPERTREWGGMAMFLNHRVTHDDPRLEMVYRNFDRNLRDILQLARGTKVKAVVSTVPSNLRDSSPFASVHRSGMTRSDLDKWESAYTAGVKAQTEGRIEEASRWFGQADRIDSNYAELHFRLGQCCAATGRMPEAAGHFTRARDLDALRFRADSRINRIIRDATASREAEGLRLVDAERAFAAGSPDGLAGHEYFYEHVHLTFEGNYLLARSVAEQVAEVMPDRAKKDLRSASTWPSLADCARRLGWNDWSRYQGAAVMLARISDPPFAGQLTHSRQTERLRLQLGQLLPATRGAGLRAAEAELRVALSAAPGDWIVERNLAQVLRQLGRSREAAEAWRGVLRKMPHYAGAWHGLGQALILQDRNDEALAAFREAARLEPGSILFLTDLALALDRSGNQSEAGRCFERALKTTPNWGPAHLGYGRMLEKMGRKEEAERHFRQALKSRVYSPENLSALARLCFEKGWINEAITNFLDSLKLNPADASTHVNLGISLGMLGRRGAAAEHYAEAVRLDPNHVEARVRLGVELGRQGRNAEALEQFGEAVRIRPGMMEAKLNLGIALWKQQRSEEALVQFKEVLEKDPTNAIALRYLQSLPPSIPAAPP